MGLIRKEGKRFLSSKEFFSTLHVLATAFTPLATLPI